MPLSEHEQRVLEQIEQSLIADDPKFSAAVKATDARVIAARKLRVSIAVVVLGLVGLVLGVWLKNVPFGVLGFCIMFGGGVLGLTAAQAGRKVSGAKSPAGSKKAAKAQKTSMKDKMEERLRRRFEE